MILCPLLASSVQGEPLKSRRFGSYTLQAAIAAVHADAESVAVTGKFEGMTENERNAVLDECFEHNDHLRANGHLVAEVPLQPPETALTLYWKNGKVATTDGPYAETKEQLGGIQILEARDLNHAIQLISQLPGFKYGLGPTR
jgi:hypothetical protein